MDEEMFKVSQQVKSLITGNIGIIIRVEKNNSLTCLKHGLTLHNYIITIKWGINRNKTIQVSCDLLDTVEII